MIYAAHKPAPPLAKFIDHLWFFDGYMPDHAMERLLPDATAEIVINLQPEPRRLYDRDNFDSAQLFKKSWFSGKQTRYIVIEAARQSSMMGIHFKPCGAYPFLGIDQSELTDTVIELDLLWGADINHLREELLDCPTVEEKFASAERFLLARFNGEPRAFRSVERVLSLMMKSPHGMAVRDFAAAVGITPKHLITQFNRVVGLKPKLCERITKFQNVLHSLENDNRIDWASVALSCGYYDQSHFIKEFKAFSGINPSAYLIDRSEYPTNVPIRPAAG